MYRPSFFALASIFSTQVLSTSVLPREFIPGDVNTALAPPGWTSWLCFEALGPDFPLFTAASYTDSATMTIEKCAAFCDSQPVAYRYMGLTNGCHCACDNYFNYVFESDGGAENCNTPCPGNASEAGGCGGIEYEGTTLLVSTYEKIDSTFITPALVPSTGLWSGLGCYTDSVSARALHARVDAGNTTVESCVAACQTQGFSLAGVEYGKECWCGSQLENGSRFYGNWDGVDGNLRQDPNFVGCTMACQGDPAELCGGPALLDLYNFTGMYPIGASVVPAAGGLTSQGCYSDLVSSRTLERRVNVAGGMTVESCVSACQSQSFTIAGLEYAQECWYGNGIKSPGAPISQRACNQACTGDNTEVCGGPNALQLYS